MRVAALVLAAGRGERLGASVPKAFLPLAGRPLVVRAIEALAARPEVERIVPVLPAADLARFAALGLAGDGRLAPPVAGGAERQDSMRAGLAALPDGVDLVAVHDAARPLVRPEDVGRVIAAAARTGAALLAVPVRDTLKRARAGRVTETLPRADCWAAQTPQVFRAALLREALAKAEAEGFVATDDAQLVERLGAPVEIVEGDPGNLKITWPEDVALAEAIWRQR
ncbi:MAG: 2-C-methyl-D-erythritol 4-phosphate cytidylyltransferase [Deltaproteobacteria bacterium]|nr:2-C-methyl-D-erythritol 4-phosphate cytidylyltransferase [Deltaproteobacteria bacterium]